ncbi:MAG: hypothetical protein C0459_13580 [Chitinophaga sp.]|jgi:GTP-binding protein EngB required for normal cell division|nr:hypothetical protein [Chitinophaga sp.]
MTKKNKFKKNKQVPLTNQQEKKQIHKLKKEVNIGAPDAETDHQLSSVFVDNGSLDALINVTNPKCIIIGRTGTGKSALIKKNNRNRTLCQDY